MAQFWPNFKIVGHLQMQNDSIIFNNPCSLLLDVKIYGRDLHLLQPENAKNNLVPRDPFKRRFMFLYSASDNWQHLAKLTINQRLPLEKDYDCPKKAITLITSISNV